MFDHCLLVLLCYTSADSNSSQLLSLNALFSVRLKMIFRCLQSWTRENNPEVGSWVVKSADFTIL